MFGLSTRAADCGGYPASILTLLTIPTPGGGRTDPANIYNTGTLTYQSFPHVSSSRMDFWHGADT